MNDFFRAGTVTIFGRPNVGKSTLLNALLGKKLSITSPKPQTTQEAILGIDTSEHAQIVYVDTPGFQKFSKRNRSHSYNRAAEGRLVGVDLVLWVIDATRWTADDDAALNILRTAALPVIVIVNKVDRVSDAELITLLECYYNLLPALAIVPVSATRSLRVDRVRELIIEHLPVRAALYAAEQKTDRDEIFIFSEMIREKIMRLTHQEVPYGTKVQIIQHKTVDQIEHIHAEIIVSKESYRGILLGSGGSTMKKIGEQARMDIEQWLERRVFLKLWVKVAG